MLCKRAELSVLCVAGALAKHGVMGITCVMPSCAATVSAAQELVTVSFWLREHQSNGRSAPLVVLMYISTPVCDRGSDSEASVSTVSVLVA